MVPLAEICAKVAGQVVLAQPGSILLASAADHRPTQVSMLVALRGIPGVCQSRQHRLLQR
jgi:hypothetical protein